jgi:hypothetical protein
MAVGDIGMVPQDGQQDQAIVLDEAYKSGYYDGTGGRKQSTSFDNRMMSMLLDCPLPKDNDDFDNYLEMIRVVIDILPRIPNYDMATYHELTRDFEDIVDQAHSEGMSRVTASDMCKMILRLRAIMPAGGQFEMKGLTPVSAIITTRHQSESTVKVPTQSPQPSGGTFGFLNPFNWGRR